MAGPKRRCVGCGKMKPKETLLRVARYAGAAAFDRTNKADGRGAYVCRRSECLNKAEKRGGLERALKTAVPKEVYGRLREEISEG